MISRGTVSNYSSFTYDTKAAWQNALMWYITKDQAHWDRSATILDAWVSNLTNIISTDRSLLIGLEGDLFVNAAEIMRWEDNWTEAGAKWAGGSRLSTQLYWLFSRQSIPIAQANYVKNIHLIDELWGMPGNLQIVRGIDRGPFRSLRSIQATRKLLIHLAPF